MNQHSRRSFLSNVAMLATGTAITLPQKIVGEELQLVDDWQLGDADFARLDREKFAPAERGYYAYFTTATMEGEAREALGEVLKVIVPSLCHKTSLKEQLPIQIAPTVYRINLLTLGWLPFWYGIIAKHYPYYPAWVDRRKYYPLLIRADWFCSDVFNENKTADSQYQLLYEGEVPKTRDDLYKFWGVQGDNEYIYGMVEGKSGVAVNDPSGENCVRGIENRTTSKRADIWITRDAAVIAGETDLLENLGKNPADIQHDASEYIVQIYKVMSGQEGKLQAYFLTDGNRIKKDIHGRIIAQQKGTRQAKAPVNIVEDKTNIIGREIQNGSSCIFCHQRGIIPPTSNEYVKYITDPTQLAADPKTKYEIERYQGSDLEKYVKLHQQQYDDGIRMCCNLDGAAFSAAYSEIVRLYVGIVDLESLAREMAVLYGPVMTARELQLALAYGSKHNILNLRTARIAESGKITRNMVIENFNLFQKAIDLWRARKK